MASKANGRDPAQRRTAIVRAAYELIAEQGLEGLRTRDVAARVGINISTLHYYYPSKGELVVDVVEHVSGLFSSARAALPEHATSLDELRSLFASRALRRQSHPELEIVVQETMLHARHDDATRAALALRQHTWGEGVKDTLVRCVRDGYLRADLEPEAAADAILAYMTGAETQLAVWPERFSFEAAAELLLSLLTAREHGG